MFDFFREEDKAARGVFQENFPKFTIFVIKAVKEFFFILVQEHIGIGSCPPSKRGDLILDSKYLFSK